MNTIFDDRQYDSDALNEAIELIKQDEIACALILNGQIIATAKGRGIKPLMEICQSNIDAAKGAILADKIIGRAASFIAIHFGIKAVYGETMSKGAMQLLSEHSVEAAQNILADEIRNRANTGICPMDSAVLNITEVEEAVSRLNEEILRLSKKQL